MEVKNIKKQLKPMVVNKKAVANIGADTSYKAFPERGSKGIRS